MKKVLLIDDRSERQRRFSAETDINLALYNDILENVTGEDYYKYVKVFLDNEFTIDHDVIIVHRSAFGETEKNILDILKEYCKKENKKLIFFSGGISSTFYINRDFEFLLVNSKVLYSDNLKLFLDDVLRNDINILKIAFGKHWKLNILLNTLEKINLYIGLNSFEEMVYYEEFKDETDILVINDFIQYQEPELRNGGVEMKKLKQLSETITTQIKQQVVLNV